MEFPKSWTSVHEIGNREQSVKFHGAFFKKRSMEFEHLARASEFYELQINQF